MGITIRSLQFLNCTVTLYNNVNLDNIALFESTLHDSVIEIGT